MGPRTIGLSILAVILTIGVPLFVSKHLQLGGNAKSPQEATLILGSTTIIAGGRAKLWYAGGDTGGDFEIRCQNEQKYFRPEPGEVESACKVDVELLNVNESTPPRATFRITWKN
ncbi:MAG: hypothetical protein IT203_08425 [Fimbriimonadaceae bacterium]|nr:hypothetical protein [Fimbriimonadaceae bacterium]